MKLEIHDDTIEVFKVFAADHMHQITSDIDLKNCFDIFVREMLRKEGYFHTKDYVAKYKDQLGKYKDKYGNNVKGLGI